MNRKPLTSAERESFREYALANRTEPNGTQCQWADYTLRLLDEIEWLRTQEWIHSLRRIGPLTDDSGEINNGD